MNVVRRRLIGRIILALALTLCASFTGQAAAAANPGAEASARAPKGAGGAHRQIGPAGDASAQGLSRVDRFRALQRDGIEVGGTRFGINDHLINGVRKSGRRQVTPEDLIDALRQSPGRGRAGSRSYANPQTGSRFFVNDADNVVGVYPRGFS